MSDKLYSKFESIGQSHEIDSRIDYLTEQVSKLQLINAENVDRYTKTDLHPSVKNCRVNK